jgi:hypothetical protein
LAGWKPSVGKVFTAAEVDACRRTLSWDVGRHLFIEEVGATLAA